MIRLGLVGYPIGHSLSPAIHQAALQACGLEGCYSLFAVHPDEATGLSDLVTRMRAGKLDGLNVTIPYKQRMIPLLDELTPTARAIGAVNTIYRRDGMLVGENTDAPGFLADLQRFMPPTRRAVVLGAGGAARAVTYALWRSNCAVYVTARRLHQARELARVFQGINPMEFSAEALEATECDLLVNATPVGMFPNIEDSPWPAGLRIPPSTSVYDLVYNPPETRLVSEARSGGSRATGGLGMLVEQAALAFELWTEEKAGREVLMETIGQGAR